jgi:hypothetical protein
MHIRLSAAALACARLTTLSLIAYPAMAHVIAGARVFPVTLTFDDPGVADEASIPALNYQRTGVQGGTGPTHEVDLGLEFDKTITKTTAIIFNDGYNIQQITGSKTQAGFQNLYVTGKWQAYTNAAHEFVASLGVIREIGGTGTLHTGADAYGSTAPTGYFGKGLGDLPVSFLRPFAVTGELSYTVADKKLKAVPISDTAAPGGGMTIASQFNTGSNNAWAGALSLQYSIPYLQTQVKDYGLPSFIGNLVPIVEVTWSSPAGKPSTNGTTWTVAPGVIYMAQWGEIGLEALIPANRTTGTTVGAVGLVHFFFDDLYPNTLGKPIFQ